MDCFKERYKVQASLDGGLSWLIVMSSFLQQFVSLGYQHIFGLFFVDLLREFKGTKATVAMIGSVAYGLTFILSPLTALICQRYGSRTATSLGVVITTLGYFTTSFIHNLPTMFLSYSVVVAVGSSLLYLSSIYILEEYFTKRLATSNGCALAGSGIGTLILMPVTEKLIRMFGWRITMRVLCVGACMLFICCVVQYFIRAPKELPRAGKDTGRPRLFDSAILKNKAFVVWLVVMGLVLFGFYIPYVHLVRHCQDFGITRKKSSLLVGYIAISETIGKVIFGRMSDHPRVNRVYLLQYAMLVCGVATTLLPIMTSASTIAVYSWIYGFHDACLVVLTAVITGDVVGREKLTEATGLVWCAIGVTMAFGPPIAGMMYESFGNYNPAFFMSGAFTILGICLLFLVPMLLPDDIVKRWHYRTKAEEVELPPKDTDISNITEKNTNQDISKFTKDEVIDKIQTGSKRTVMLKEGPINRLSWAFDRYKSMEHLVGQKDCVPSRVYSTENLYRVDNASEDTTPIRETVV